MKKEELNTLFKNMQKHKMYLTKNFFDGSYKCLRESLFPT